MLPMHTPSSRGVVQRGPVGRLLITTQAVDLEDPVLGFFHRWLQEFAKHCESIEVICLREGQHSLPSNVFVHSLSKSAQGRPASGWERFWLRLRYCSFFYRYIFLLRGRYDAVFVHMNPEYVVLGGVFWRLWGKRVGLWYNHASRNLWLAIAKRIANVIFTTSLYSASVSEGKTYLMPAGIDTDVFRPLPTARVPLSIYYQGRIAPAKRVELLCEAVQRLRQEGIAATATIVGPEEGDYGKRLRGQFRDLILQNGIVFSGPKRNEETPEFFARHAVSVNLASRSGLDKSVLESCACRTPAIASSEAFGDIVPNALRFKEGDLDSLVQALKTYFAMSGPEREALGERLRALVVEQHSLSLLVSKVLGLMIPAQGFSL